MRQYMAPMEGLTGYVYRNAFHRHFGSIDKYFTPFLTNKKLSRKEQNDILPEHNAGMRVVPQILTNRAEDFLAIAAELKNYGYTSVNLNLGCPSGTVVAKNRGAGFLAQREELERFLGEIFETCPLKISVKTRIGKDSPDEWEHLLLVYEKFPLEELIIHPRIQKDYYKNKPNLSAFEMAEEKSRQPLCYNGDIFTVADYEKIRSRFQKTEAVMLGRGILMNPFLPGQMAEGIDGTGERRMAGAEEKEILRAFHDELLESYWEMMSDERNVLFRMKELWSYLGESFTDSAKYMKKIRKSAKFPEYRAFVDALFREQDFLMETGTEAGLQEDPF